MNRPIEYYSREYVPSERRYKTTLIGIAVFHAFGVSYEEFENGPGNFSTAIIELPDDKVENVDVDLIKFIDIA